MPAVIDFHSHMLPGLDDGADFISDSLQMARMAREDGTRGVVLTPHHYQGRYNNGRKKVLARTGELRQRLKKEGIGLVVFPAAEAHLCPNLPELAALNDILTVNDLGRHLLVELPFSTLPAYTGSVLANLINRGITPILAHPERCRPLVGDLDFLYSLLNRGVLLQINTGSITGDFGREWEEVARLMVRQHWVHLLGSDAHSVNQRPPGLSRALERIENLAGSRAAGLISRKWPRQILQGRDISPWRPLPPPGRQI
ncbi:MAG: tyrosine-protein phosphatase [Bacillota bacterium]